MRVIAARWHEYARGKVGDVALAAIRTTYPAATGMVMVFVTLLVVGLAHDEDGITGILEKLGVSFDDALVVNRIADSLLMAAFPLAMLLGLVAFLLYVLAVVVRDVMVSRNLVKSVQRGAPRDQVPVPSQVESVARDGHWSLCGFLTIAMSTAMLVGVISVGVSLGRDDTVGLLIGAGCGILAVGAGLGLLFMEKYVHPAHHRRRMIIATHWTAEDEAHAWRFAREAVAGRNDVERDSSAGRDRRVSRGRTMTAWAAQGFVVTIVVVFFAFRMIYPQAWRYHKGERADLPPPVENAVAAVFALAVAALVVAAALMLVGNIIEGVGRRTEKASLRALVGKPDGMPSEDLLVEYSGVRPLLLAWAAAQVGGALLVLGPALLILGIVTEPDGTPSARVIEEQSQSFLAQLSIPGILTTTTGLLLLVGAGVWNLCAARRGEALRNALLERWPVLPREANAPAVAREKGHHPAARVGPALTPEDDRETNDIGK